jgi:hypothetical protein
MSQISRPMQIALAATLLLCAVWFTMLRPKPSTHAESAAAPSATPAQPTQAPAGPTAPGAAGLGRAVEQAHGAVTTANGDAARAQQTGADGSAQPAGSTAAGAGSSATARPVEPHARHTAAPASAQRRTAASSQVRAVKAALRSHRAVAIAFVDPHTADARGVAQEMRHVSHFGGRAVTLAVPLTRLSDYDFITKSVEVTVAPTVVIVDPRRRAATIVGFADRGEIEQRLADALAVKRR